jgi:hypothetical protein
VESIKREAYTEIAEGTEFTEKRESTTLDRKNPPFARSAKDGAPSSTSSRGVTVETQEHSQE